jgi:hypothetical protein
MKADTPAGPPGGARQLQRPSAAAAGASRERQAVPTPVAKVLPQDRVIVTGAIKSATPMSISGFPACRYSLADDTGEVDLMFLGRVVIAGLEPGRRCRAEGMAATRDDRIVIWNPRYELIE